jgi:hypothetical protein
MLGSPSALERTILPRIFQLTGLAIACAALFLGGCDSDEVMPVDGIGQIWVTSTKSSSVVTADYRRLRKDPLRNCPPSTAISNNCRVGNCQYSPEELGAPQSAGTIRVTGGLEDVELEPDEENLYRVERDQPLFEGGEVLSIEIGGNDEIEEVSMNVEAPEFVSVTTPAPPMSEEEEPLAIDRSKDLEIEWTPVSEGVVRAYVGVSQTLEDSGDIWRADLWCYFDADSGKGTLLAKDLTKYLPVAEDPTTAQLWVGTEVGDRTWGLWEHWFVVSAYESRPVTIQ